MLFKTGDRVTIGELEVGKEYSSKNGHTDTVVDEMLKYSHRRANITHVWENIEEDYLDGSYSIDIDDGCWSWTDEMFLEGE